MHGQLPVIWDRAKDFSVWDIHGNKFIDFSSTIFVANTGHGNPSIIKAIITMLKKPLFHAYTYPTKIRADYLEFLIDNLRSSCGDWVEKAFLVSSGTEAIECSIKLMRMYGRLGSPKKNKIISFTGNWHGRTLGAQMLSSVAKQKEWIGYEDPNIIRLPFPYPWNVNESDGRSVFSKNLEKYGVKGEEVAGFVLESYQGWACAFYPVSFVEAIKEYSFKYDIVLTFDEIQSGFGRTGKMFASEHYGVVPDIQVMAKGLSGGVPLGAFSASFELMNKMPPASHGSTWGGNPIACRASLKLLEIMERDNVLANVNARSEQVFKFFEKHFTNSDTRNTVDENSEKTNEPKRGHTFSAYHNPKVQLRGLGLMIAIVLPDNATALKVKEHCFKNKILTLGCGTNGNIIRLAPDLTITEANLQIGLDAIAEAIKK
jgi:4-aminobutyrate aminotransferase-like enzyme